MHRCEQQRADALRRVLRQYAGRLPLSNQLEHDRKRALSGFVQRVGLSLVLAREHQLQQRRVGRCETDIRGPCSLQAVSEIWASTVHCLVELGAEPSEAVLGERFEQRLAVREVAAGRHPGYAATNLQSHSQNRRIDFLLLIGNRLFAQSEVDGALPTLYAAVADIPGNSFAGPGRFMQQRGAPKLVGRSDAAQDMLAAIRLWEVSEMLTGVKFPLGVSQAA